MSVDPSPWRLLSTYLKEVEGQEEVLEIKDEEEEILNLARS